MSGDDDGVVADNQRLFRPNCRLAVQFVPGRAAEGASRSRFPQLVTTWLTRKQPLSMCH